jgi:hypothetical protein
MNTPQGSAAAAQELKPWKCCNGHVMGLTRRNGSKVQQLLLYRQALDMTPGAEKEEVDVIAVVIGKTVDVRCSVCGGIRSWFPVSERRANLDS